MTKTYIYNNTNQKILNKAKHLFENFEKKENVDLKNFSTMRVGGIGLIVVYPKDETEIVKILSICKQNDLKWMILGAGSNVLFSDDGFDGVLISLKYFNQMYVKTELETKDIGKEIICQVGAGVNLFTLNMKLAELGLSGLEWCFGIPATLGGLLFMNGGCFGHEIGDIVEEVSVLDDGVMKKLVKSDLQFSYRHSNLQKYIILSASLRLVREKSEIVRENMNSYLQKKREKQPCEFASLGSIFKRVGDVIPAKIIDEMGLKGTRIGGAEISKKHAGFIVNTGDATSADIRALIELVEAKFAEKNIPIEKEIIML